jgi:hypothetical protein
VRLQRVALGEQHVRDGRIERQSRYNRRRLPLVIATIQTGPPQAHWRRLMSSTQGHDAAEEAVAAILATPPLDELEESIMHARAPDVIVH